MTLRHTLKTASLVVLLSALLQKTSPLAAAPSSPPSSPLMWNNHMMGATDSPAGPTKEPILLDPFRELFDHVYVITVESRRSRVTAVLESLNFLSASSSGASSSFATIMPAVLKPITESDWSRVRAAGDFDLETLTMLTAGEVAVSLSQRKVLRQFLNNNNNNNNNNAGADGNYYDDGDDDAVVLIFEDDFAENGFGVRERLDRSARYLVAGSWDILFLGRCHDTCDNDVLLGGDLYRVYAPACLHAYAVTKKGAKIILKAASACKGPNCPIDNVVRTAISTGQLRATAVSPQLFTQDRIFRGQGSLVGADAADLDRMLPTGDHLKHALRRGENADNRNSNHNNKEENNNNNEAEEEKKKKKKKNDNSNGHPPRHLPECKAWHERLLISNVNAFADRHAIRPRPGSLGERMSAHRSHGEEHRPWEERWVGVMAPPPKLRANAVLQEDNGYTIVDQLFELIGVKSQFGKYLFTVAGAAIVYKWKCWRRK